MIDYFSVSKLDSELSRKIIMGLTIMLSFTSLSLLIVTVAGSSPNFSTVERTSWAVGKVVVLEDIYVGLVGYYVGGETDVIFVSWSFCHSLMCTRCARSGYLSIILLVIAIAFNTLVVGGSMIRSGMFYEYHKHRYTESKIVKLTVLVSCLVIWILTIIVYSTWNNYCFSQLPGYGRSDFKHSYGFNSVVASWFLIAWVGFNHEVLPYQGSSSSRINSNDNSSSDKGINGSITNNTSSDCLRSSSSSFSPLHPTLITAAGGDPKMPFND